MTKLNFNYTLFKCTTAYDGRVILIGDAAHAKSLTRARGMTSGWEDGLSLSRHLMSSANMAEALANFQAERLPIVHEYQRTSREIILILKTHATVSLRVRIHP